VDRIQFLVLSTTLLGCAIAIQPVVGQNASAQTAEMARSAAPPIYAKWCGDCHTTVTGPGSVALQRKYQGRLPAVLDQRSDLSPEYVKLVVRRGISFMPSFRKTEISDAELALVAAYLAPARGRTQ